MKSRNWEEEGWDSGRGYSLYLKLRRWVPPQDSWGETWSYSRLRPSPDSTHTSAHYCTPAARTGEQSPRILRNNQQQKHISASLLCCWKWPHFLSADNLNLKLYILNMLCKHCFHLCCVSVNRWWIMSLPGPNFSKKISDIITMWSLRGIQGSRNNNTAHVHRVT